MGLSELGHLSRSRSVRSASNLISAGNAVLHSAMAVEKLGNGQNRSINNGSGPGDYFVSKTI